MSHINQADGSGKLEIGGDISPVSYQVLALPAEDGDGKKVQIRLSAPRDWLLERGFEQEADLIRQDGSRETVRAVDRVSTDDPIAVVLTSDAQTMSEEDMGRRYPELVTH